jgi:hypothetical protein
VGWSQLNSDVQQDLGISFKNRIINGAMIIDQRNAGASVSTSSGISTYTLDRWGTIYAATSKFTVQQNAGSVTPPAGYINYLGVTSSAATTILVVSILVLFLFLVDVWFCSGFALLY